jgi:hypothetical protein
MTWEHAKADELARFLEGDLDEARLVEIAVHLDECPQCMGVLQQQDDLHLVVAASPDPELPAGLVDAVWSAVQADAQVERPAGPPPAPEPRASAPSALAVAAVLGASAAGLLVSAGAPAEAAETMSAATLAVGALARALGLDGVAVPLSGLGVAAVTIASTIQLVRARRQGRAA